MLQPDTGELDARIARHPLTPKGRALVASMRSASAPARQVRGGSSVTVRYSSHVMGRAMHLESRGFELPVAVHLDNGRRTREFYAQPTRIEVPVRKDGALRAAKISIVPDFFAIEDDESNDVSGLAMPLISAKPAKRMPELAQADPDRFERDENGRWHDRLVEEHVRETYGLAYVILTDEDISAVEVRNANYEEDYLLAPVDVPAEVRARLTTEVSRRPGVSGRELKEASEASVDCINQLAVDGDIWYPRDRELLKDLDRVHFYPSRLMGEAILALPAPRSVPTGAFEIAVGSSFAWGERSYQIVNFRDDLVDCLSDGVIVSMKRDELARLFVEGQIVPEAKPASVADAIANLSPKAQARFLARHRAVQDALDGKRPSSSARRWLREYERRTLIEGTGVRAFIPNFRSCGRWGRRISSDDQALAIDVIKTQYLTPDQRTLVFAYAVYCKRFANEVANSDGSRRPMSRLSFTRILHTNWTAEDIARERHGYKAANQAKLRGPIAGGRVDAGLPTRGDRAWERVPIDHTKLDIFIVDSVTRETIGRVWASAAVDAYSGKLLELELSLHDPSNKLPMQLIRKLVRRYHRLPRTIITDNGSEFRSEYFQTFCATYGIRLEYRPPATPRAGSPVESIFHSLNVPLHTLVGNAKPGQNPRSLDKDLHPEKRAIWTLDALEHEFKPRVIELLNARPDPVRGLSADEIYARSIGDTGLRASLRIAYDEAFLALSALPRKNDLQVGRDGVVVGKVAYWCEAFRDAEVQGTTVPVRDEPFDISRKYAFVNGRWHTCRSERFREELEGRTETEIEVASKQLAARLNRPAELSEIVSFLLEMQGVEKRLADEQRAARRGELVTERQDDNSVVDTHSALNEAASEAECEDAVEATSDEDSAW